VPGPTVDVGPESWDEVDCDVIRWVNLDDFPGWVEVELIDADGEAHRFVDKWPMFGSDIRANSVLPMPAAMRCTVVARDRGRGRVTIMTAEPDAMVSTTGQDRFDVPDVRVRRGFRS
jgi:hypothetical protein